MKGLSEPSVKEWPIPMADQNMSSEGQQSCLYLDAIRKDTCRIRFCEWFDEKSKIWNYSRHAHDCIELIYFLEGKADIRDEDHSMALSLFELVVYPKGVHHQEFLDTRYRQAIICLHLECETDLSFDRLFKLKDESGALRWLMKQIHHEYHHPGPFQQDLLRDLVSLLVDMMRKNAHEFQAPKANIPEKCLQYIQEHFAEPIDLHKLAESAFVSTSYLNRVFRRRYNTTPIQYLNRYRIEIAREMLVKTGTKVSAIARFVGFEDPKHFAKLFRSTTGFTPIAYRTAFSNRPD